MAREKKHASTEARIEGFLEEVELENGDMALQIVGDDRSYLIEMDKQGRKLLRAVGEEVEIIGHVTRDQEGYKIRVVSCEVLEDFGDSDEELDYDDDEDDDDFMSDRYDE